MITRYLIIHIMMLCFFSCDHHSIIEDLEEQIVEKSDTTQNSTHGVVGNDSTKTTLPDKTPEDSLKILAIGNSFTDDGMAFLPGLIGHAGLSKVKVAKIVVGGTSLQYHYNHAIRNDSVYGYYVSEGGRSLASKGKTSFQTALSDDRWDIVVMQQVSQYSGLYHTYQPYLDSLIAFVHRQLPQAVIAWQMTWAYGSSSNHSGFANYNKNQTTMYDAICATVAEAKKESDIDVVIPSGMTIQKLRSTQINNPPLDLTRDGYHLDLGAGRYAAACTWFESLIAPVYHTSCIGNTLRSNSGNVHVTDDIATICQQAAHDAVIDYQQVK